MSSLQTNLEFSAEEWRRIRAFQKRTPMVVKAMLDSLNESALEHDKPRNQRKLPR